MRESITTPTIPGMTATIAAMATVLGHGKSGCPIERRFTSTGIDAYTAEILVSKGWCRYRGLHVYPTVRGVLAMYLTPLGRRTAPISFTDALKAAMA